MINYKLALDLSEHPSLTIGILSDTHGSLHPDIALFIQQCDIALHAGDIMGAKPLQQLKPKLGRTFAVKGNNDAPSTWDTADISLLSDLPDAVELTLPGGILVMEHSHRMWNRDVNHIHRALRTEYPHAQLVIYGHTHIRTIDNSAIPAVANPGAAGKIRLHDGPSCLALTVNAEQWTLQSYIFKRRPIHLRFRPG